MHRAGGEATNTGLAALDPDRSTSLGGRYPHSQGKSITGGFVYRGCNYPKLQGKYIFGDYVSGRIWAISQPAGANANATATAKGSSMWDARELTWGDASVCTGGLTGEIPRGILAFGQDRRGELYILTSRSAKSSEPDGYVHRIIEPTLRADPSQCGGGGGGGGATGLQEPPPAPPASSGPGTAGGGSAQTGSTTGAAEGGVGAGPDAGGARSDVPGGTAAGTSVVDAPAMGASSSAPAANGDARGTADADSGARAEGSALAAAAAAGALVLF